MLMVIIGHIPSHTLNPYISDSAFLKTIMLFHMPAFFFVSGYVANSKPSVKKVKEKLFHYSQPLIVIGLLSEFLLYEGSPKHFFYTTTWNSYWYLWCMTIFTFMMYPRRIYYHISGMKALTYDVNLLVAIIALLLLLYKILPGQVNHCLSIYLLLAYFPFFWLGYIVRRHIFVERFVTNKWIVCLSFLLSMILGMLFYQTSSIVLHGFSGICITFILLKLFKIRDGHVTKVENHLLLWGRYSLDIYLFQFFFLKVIDVRKVGLWCVDNHHYLVEFIIMLLIAVIVSYVCVGIGVVLRKNSLARKIIYGDGWRF